MTKYNDMKRNNKGRSQITIKIYGWTCDHTKGATSLKDCRLHSSADKHDPISQKIMLDSLISGPNYVLHTQF